MIKRLKNKSGMTISELIIAILIMGVVAALILPSIRKSDTKTFYLKVKKSHETIKEIVNDLLSNNETYAGDNDFSTINTRVVGSQVIKDTGTFRNAFTDKLTLNSEFKCYFMIGKTLSNTENCYESNDRVVWGIPLTDFDLENTVEVKKNGLKQYYVPITVYPNYKQSEADKDGETYFYNNAIVYGLRRDGDLIFLDGVIDCNQYPKSAHCNAINYITQVR